MDPETPEVWRGLMVELLAIGATVWTLLKFIFEPRLTSAIEAKAKAIADARVEPITTSIAEMQEKLDELDRESVVQGAAVRRITEAVDRSTHLLQRVADKLESQGKSLAYIEGTMRNRHPREPWPNQHRGDDDEEAR